MLVTYGMVRPRSSRSVIEVSQIQYSHMVAEKQSRDLGGLVYAKIRRTWVEVREECGTVDMGRRWVRRMYVKVYYVRMMSYFHERRSTIFEGQPPSWFWRKDSTPDRDPGTDSWPWFVITEIPSCLGVESFRQDHEVGWPSKKHPEVLLWTTDNTIGHSIDSGIDLSITIDKFRVFINKTLSILSAY